MPAVGTAISYESPIGFSNYAEDFALWAEKAHDEGSKFFSPVPFYLYCRSLELVLKAFLLARGLPKAELKRRTLGHDLEQLLTRAKELGLDSFVALAPEMEGALKRANAPYTNKNFEYFESGFGYYRDSELPLLRQLSAQLRETVRPLCIAAADLPSPPALPSTKL